jgi:hypothetical protein
MDEDKRLNKRHPLVAEIDYLGEGMRQRGRISDLSQGGLFIDTINPLDRGCPVSFTFLLPGDTSGKPIAGEGVVAWQQPMLGMGIRFISLAEGDLDRILRFLKIL